MKYFKEQYRRTFDGRKVKNDDLTHQHLSNIVWYNDIFFPNSKDIVDRLYEDLLEYKFGERLPYSPDTRFTAEIEQLESRGMIAGRGKTRDIYHNGILIGSVYYE